MNDQTTFPARQRSPSAAAPLGRLRNEIDRLFDDFGLGWPARSVFGFATPAELNPAMELATTKDGYELSVELPGIDEKDIEIVFADGVLTVSGEKHEESEKKENGYLLNERRYGSFHRQLTLPANVDPETIEAKFGQGVLKLAMKKDRQAADRARKIKIG